MTNSLQKNNRYVHNFFNSFFRSPKGSAAGWGHPQKYPAHTRIFRQDTPAEAVYFIEQGLMKMSRIDFSGREIIAGLRRRQWIVGAPAVLLRKPYSFTYMTLTECALRRISAESFIKLVQTDKDFNLHLLAMLSQEIFTYAKNTVNLGCLSAVDRLKRLLSDIITEIGQPADQKQAVRIQLPLKNRELAQMIAVTPEHLSRLLKALERDGIIQRDRNRLTVKDCRSLMPEGGM